MPCARRSCACAPPARLASGRVSLYGLTSSREPGGVDALYLQMTEEWLMFGNQSIGKKGWGMRGLAAALLLMGATIAGADEAAPDSVLDGWLGGEFTVQSSTLNDHMPVGGKLTFIFDGSDNVVRICTRSVAAQRGPWRMDFASPCGVTMTFTRGTRFCTFEDVKAGNAEV